MRLCSARILWEKEYVPMQSVYGENRSLLEYYIEIIMMDGPFGSLPRLYQPHDQQRPFTTRPSPSPFALNIPNAHSYLAISIVAPRFYTPSSVPVRSPPITLVCPFTHFSRRSDTWTPGVWPCSVTVVLERYRNPSNAIPAFLITVPRQHSPYR